MSKKAPATYVSWYDAVSYCEWLSERERKTYRLPTEAEWEYACREGTTSTWSFGNDKMILGDYAWYDENGDDIREKYAHQVELKKPNAFGLYDTHGNVYEWCHDYYEEVYNWGLKKDPQGPASSQAYLSKGSFRVLRGGSWLNRRRDARSARRGKDAAGDLGGFRVVRELD